MARFGESDEFALRVQAHWGASHDRLGDKFACPLPRHPGRASLYLDPVTESWRLRCWCRDHWHGLGDVRAAMAYGGPVDLSNIERTVWHRRLAYDLGDLKPALVSFPAISPDEPQAAIAVLHGFLLLAGLRWIDLRGLAVPFTRIFGAAWTGVGEHPVRAAIDRLLDLQAIVLAGHSGRLRLFLPGPGVAT